MALTWGWEEGWVWGYMLPQVQRVTTGDPVSPGGLSVSSLPYLASRYVLCVLVTLRPEGKPIVVL